MLTLDQVSKSYRKRVGGGETVLVHALDQVSLSISQGDFAVFHGASGSGKSTLLLTLGAMLAPTCGKVAYENTDIYRRSSLWRNRFRRRTVGFIFQKFHLMPYLTVRENILLPLSFRQRHKAKEALETLAKRLELDARLQHYPNELSVGEQQRAALARTLICKPKLILADEPTGNLDPHNSAIIAQCLREEHQAGATLLLVTHDPALIDIGSHSYELSQGHICT